VKECLWEELTRKGLKGCQWEVGPRGESTGGRGDTGRPWETGNKGIASGDTIVALGRQIIFADEVDTEVYTSCCIERKEREHNPAGIQRPYIRFPSVSKPKSKY